MKENRRGKIRKLKNHSGSTSEKRNTWRVPWRERASMPKCIIITFQNIRDLKKKKKDSKISLKVKTSGSKRHKSKFFVAL